MANGECSNGCGDGVEAKAIQQKLYGLRYTEKLKDWNKP